MTFRPRHLIEWYRQPFAPEDWDNPSNDRLPLPDVNVVDLSTWNSRTRDYYPRVWKHGGRLLLFLRFTYTRRDGFLPKDVLLQKWRSALGNSLADGLVVDEIVDIDDQSLRQQVFETWKQSIVSVRSEFPDKVLTFWVGGTLLDNAQSKDMLDFLQSQADYLIPQCYHPDIDDAAFTAAVEKRLDDWAALHPTILQKCLIGLSLTPGAAVAVRQIKACSAIAKRKGTAGLAIWQSESRSLGYQDLQLINDALEKYREDLGIAADHEGEIKYISTSTTKIAFGLNGSSNEYVLRFTDTTFYQVSLQLLLTAVQENKKIRAKGEESPTTPGRIETTWVGLK